MSYPQIVYNPGSGNVTLAFTRGPLDFTCEWAGRVHDNLSTSGLVRERVVENLDILISFQMPHMIADQDMPGWASFLAFALAGGEFQFYPSSTLADNYNCVLEDAGWKPKWNAIKKYGSTITLRVLQDSSAPSDPGVVLRRFYGITS
jgi:hypothetical protein